MGFWGFWMGLGCENMDIKISFEKYDFANVIYGTEDTECISLFRSHYQKQIDSFIKNIHSSYLRYLDLSKLINGSERKSHITLFVFASINNIALACKFLLSSLLPASGHHSRMFVEAILSSMLMSKDNLDQKYYKDYASDFNSFKSHKVFRYIENNLMMLKMPKDSWENIKKIKDHYNHFCHASAFSLATNYLLEKKEEPGSVLILGSAFDSRKLALYTKELDRLISASTLINSVIDYLILEFKTLK